MVWGQIAGAVIGGVLANKAAKQQSSVADRAATANPEAYRDARPYVRDLYKGGTEALQNQLDQGYYNDPTYAGLNQQQTTGLDNQFALGQRGYGYGNRLLEQGAGFGTNYQNLYNQAGQDQIGNARQYANDNAQPLVNAALRDSTRQLNENTLTNIGLGASATGNANSSPKIGDS